MDRTWTCGGRKYFSWIAPRSCVCAPGIGAIKYGQRNRCIIRITKEMNEDIVTGTVAGKLAMPDKGYLIRDRDGNEFIVECSEASFGSKSYETIKFNEEVIIKGMIINNIMIATRRKGGFRKSLAEKTDKVKSRKVMMAFEVNSTGRTIGNDEGTILNLRQALGPL